MGYFFTLILATFTNLTNFFFCIMPIVKDIRMHFKGMELLKGLPFKAVWVWIICVGFQSLMDIKWIDLKYFPFSIWSTNVSFPFDIYYTPMYEIIFAISAWSGFITICGITSMDGLFVGLCLHVAGQFDIIRSRLDTLIEVEIGKWFEIFW